MTRGRCLPILLLAAALSACSHWQQIRSAGSLHDSIARCKADPTTFGEAFPQHQLKTLMLKEDASDPTAVERYVAPIRCDWGAIVNFADEPVLSKGVDSETYRLLVLREGRGSSPTVELVRLTAHPNGRFHVTVKRIIGTLHDKVNAVEERSFDADEQQSEAVRRAIDAAHCWDDGHTCQAAEGIYGKRMFLDGITYFVLEGARGSEHWAVEVPYPPAGHPFQVACERVAQAGQLSFYW